MAFVSLFSLSLQLSCILVVVLLYKTRKQVKQTFNAVLSKSIHFYLVARYPIRSIHDQTSLPTCPYEWPNGQGDTAKFLNGPKNSEIWASQYGPIYRLWSGMASEVVLTRPEDVQAVFRDSDKHFKAENNNSGYLMSQILGRCVGLISRDDWKRVRSIMEQPFVRSTSTAYLSQISRRTKSYFRELSEKGDFSRGSLAPADDLKLLPFLVVAEIVYGAPLAPEVEKELRELAPQREALFRHVIGGGISRFSWSKYLPIASNRELAAFQQRWLAFNELAYRHAVEEHPGAPIVTFFQARASGELSTAELLHTLDEILYANLDVTAGGMSWNIVFLAAHRDVQTRLRAEIASKRAEAATYQDEELPSTYMLSSFTLLAACVNESARLRPLAAFSVPQSVPSERVVSGYQFPRRTNFIVDSYALNIRNPHWGEDRASYRPDRFLAREATSSRYHYWRFGFGPRQCMGRYVADAIIRAIILHLVENYELRTEGKDAGDWERNKEIWIDHPDLRVSCVKMSN